MTDYNDGQIHGWNGGECPVHTKTVVAVWFRCKDSDIFQANALFWHHADACDDIVAFRVVKPYVEPKVIWVNEHNSLLWVAHHMTDAELIEQLAAARQDAKEAEAYAEEMEKGLNTCRMAQAVLDNTVADLEAKLAKAVEVLSFAGNVDTADWSEALDVRNQARATLAEIKGETHDPL